MAKRKKTKNDDMEHDYSSTAGDVMDNDMGDTARNSSDMSDVDDDINT